MKNKLLIFLIVSFLFQSCAVLTPATSAWINKKIASIPEGASKSEATAKLAIPPDYLATFPRGKDRIEVLGFDLGHYWYHEVRLLIFKNDRLVLKVDDFLDLMQYLYDLRIIDEASFVRHGK